jgi:uncharacterized protein YecT (DUF1311 family)
MAAKRDYVAEIKEIRDRTGPRDWDNGITKLLFLSIQIQKLEKEGEAIAYFPVAIIAAIETYFRWEIRELIDSGDPRYLDNLRGDDLPLKITYDHLVAVHGKRVSIGELVAHSVRLNNLEAISKTMSDLLQSDFFVLVKESRDPELRRKDGLKAPTLIKSATETFARVKRTFELRHIICHEAHLNNPVTLDEAKELCSSCYEFARASRCAIAHHDNPDAPLTLEEAYDATKKRVRSLDEEITAVEKRIISTINPDTRAAFEAMQGTWRAYVEREADFNASQQMNGSRGALYAQSAMEGLYKERRDKLNEYAETLSAARFVGG